MNKMLRGSLVIAAFVLVGCGKENKSADIYGSCTPETLASYNDIMFNARQFNSSKNTSYLYSARTACSKFKSIIGSDTCKATAVETGEEITLSWGKASDVCSEVNLILAN